MPKQSMTERLAASQGRGSTIAVPSQVDRPERDIPLVGLEPNPVQPRKFFDDASIKELADTLIAEGQLQAIGIYQDRDDNNTYILFGERRVRAARKAGWVTIRAKDFGRMSSAAARVIALLENLGREDLTLFDEVTGYKVLAGEGMSGVDIARRVGRPASYVSRCLTIASEDEVMLEIERAGRDASFVASYNRAKQVQTQRGEVETRGRKPSVESSQHDLQQSRQTPSNNQRDVDDEVQGDFVSNLHISSAATPSGHNNPASANGTKNVLNEQHRVRKSADTLLVHGQYMSFIEISEFIAELTNAVLSPNAPASKDVAPPDVEELIRQLHSAWSAVVGRYGQK